jgi:flagellar hook capping protein FlgD
MLSRAAPVSNAIRSVLRGRDALRSLAIATALFALPAPASSGVDLTWNDCPLGGALNKNFTCTGTSNQNYNLFVTFSSPVPVPSFVGLEATIGLVNASPDSLAPFWHYESGGCNNTGSIRGIAMSDVIPPFGSCYDSFGDPWDQGINAFPGFVYTPNSPRPGHGILRTFVSLDQGTFPIDPGVYYYAFHLTFNNRNRTSCAGCAQQVALRILDLKLYSNDGSPPVRLSGPDQSSDCALVNNPPNNPALCSQVVGIPPDTRSFTRLLMHPPRPNPTRGAVVVPFELPAMQSVVAQVFDTRGRLVRTLANGQLLSPGPQAVSWDGKDGEGATLPAGMYLVSVRAGAHLGVRKVALLP